MVLSFFSVGCVLFFSWSRLSLSCRGAVFFCFVVTRLFRRIIVTHTNPGKSAHQPKGSKWRGKTGPHPEVAFLAITF